MNKYTIPNLKNACEVLKTLTSSADGLSTGDLSAQLEVPRTSMLRILSTLEEAGFVERIDKRFRLGNLIVHMGLQAMNRIDIVAEARPILKELSLTTQETTHLAQQAGTQMLIQEVCDSPNIVRVASRPGTLADIHCSATGKIIMAYAIDDLPKFVKTLPKVKRTERTILTDENLIKEAQVTLNRGFGLDDIEYTEGVRCLAAPVYNAKGKVVAALGITGSIATFSRDRIENVAKETIKAADKLSNKLGWIAD